MSKDIIRQDKSFGISADLEKEQFKKLLACFSEREVSKEDLRLSSIKVSGGLAIKMSLQDAREIISESNHKLKIVYDHQVLGATDQPHTAQNIIRSISQAGVHAAIVGPFSDREDVAESCIRYLEESNIGVIVNADPRHSDMERPGEMHEDAYKRVFHRALELGVRDFMVPGDRPSAVESYRQFFEKEVGEGEFMLHLTGFSENKNPATISVVNNVAGRRWHAIVGRAIIGRDGIVIPHEVRAKASRFSDQISEVSTS